MWILVHQSAIWDFQILGWMIWFPWKSETSCQTIKSHMNTHTIHLTPMQQLLLRWTVVSWGPSIICDIYSNMWVQYITRRMSWASWKSLTRNTKVNVMEKAHNHEKTCLPVLPTWYSTNNLGIFGILWPCNTFNHYAKGWKFPCSSKIPPRNQGFPTHEGQCVSQDIPR